MAKKDIIVISKPERSKKLTSIERDILYNEIKTKYKIDQQHIDNFKQGDDILYEIQNRLDISSIESILLKNILKYTYPIINSYPNKLKKKDKNINNGLLVTLDYELYSLLFIDSKKQKLELIKIPQHTEISVIGLVFPFFSKNYYPIFKWFFKNNSELYMYSNEFISKDNIFRNNIQLIEKYINENINNLIFNQSPNNLINLKEFITNTKYNKYDDLLKHSYLFNTKHNIELFNQIASMIKYYLDFYDKYLLNIINQNIYKSQYKILKLNYFINSKYYNILPKLNKDDNKIKLYNEAIDNTYTISDNYKLTVIDTFRQLNLSILYDYIYLYGFDSKIVKNYIEKLKSHNKVIKQNKENEKKIAKNKLINIIYERIAEIKFPNLFNANHKDNLFNTKNFFNMLKLSKKYRDIILIEYKKQEEFLKAFANNKCPHLKLLNQFRYTKNTKQKNYYFKLLKEFINTNAKDDLSYYACNNCNFDIICPHSYETQIELLKIDNDLLSNKLDNNYNINQKIIDKYMSNAPIDFIYFCKICSEEIGKSFYLEQPTEFQDNVRLNAAQDDDTLLSQIYKTTYHIVYKYINFNILTINKKKLITNIVEIIHPYISDLEIQINKNKSYDELSKTNHIHLNIVIYIYASIIQIMMLNKDLTFNEDIIQQKKSKPEESKLIVEKPEESKLIVEKSKPEKPEESKLIVEKSKSKLIVEKSKSKSKSKSKKYIIIIIIRRTAEDSIQKK